VLPGIVACCAALALRDRRSLIVIPILVGLVVGTAADRRAAAIADAPVPAGRIELVAVATSDPARGARPVATVKPVSLSTAAGWAPWNGPTLLLVEPPPDLAVGESVRISGIIEPPFAPTYRGRPIAGVIDNGRSTRLGPAANPLLALGNVLRRHVLGGLDAAQETPPGSLLAGFLIGDVSHLPRRDGEALRSAGLSHFVAVSGSNVALFLAAWWIVGGPLGIGPRRRAVFGLVGIMVFAIVTRWEPSVVRASVMAALVLVGRWSGRPISPWTALGGAISLSLIVAPELAGDVGFGLSVAATGGIIAGAPVWSGRRPAAVWAVLGATISAQVAVAPLLLIWFGKVPLMAPVTNLVAAPLVSMSTAVGGVGAVLGIDLMVSLGVGLAGLVLAVARTAADLPQLGPVAALATGSALVAAVKAGWLRPVMIFGAAVWVVMTVVPVAPPAVPTVTFLDVGQGDATVFAGPSGEVILFDGGPDPDLLAHHLTRLGVTRIDLLVITHLHADHTTGLVGITAVASVGMVWHPPQEGEGGPFDRVLAEVRASGAPVMIPRPGDRVAIGSFELEALGPVRRYDGPNDGSVVVEVRAAGSTVTMTGDAEVPAQRDLRPLRGDVMKVPHQGAATSDLDWLRVSAPRVAVISVGDNDYGHPSDAVIAAFEAVGTIVLRTDVNGSVSLPLDQPVEAAARLASAG
jgi:competence protein ComEC